MILIVTCNTIVTYHTHLDRTGAAVRRGLWLALLLRVPQGDELEVRSWLAEAASYELPATSSLLLLPQVDRLLIDY